MAGTNDLQLQLLDGTNTYTFDYDGRLRIEQEYQYNENPEPPELRQIIERWHVDSARIVGATQATAWDNLQAFLGHTEDRTATPLTHARLLRSGATVERTLGSTNWEGFRLESLTLGDEPITELEAAEMRTVWPVSFVLLAVRPFADSNGIVSWEQTIRSNYSVAGLHTLEWETALSVAEGSATTALSLAESYAVIPIADYGNTYVWDTNGPSTTGGYDLEEADPDTRSSPNKTPTKLRIVSRIRQLGITVGTPTAGESIGDAEESIITERVANKLREITEASAEGPGSYAWVTGKRPNGNIKESSVRWDKASRRAFGRWVVETKDQAGNAGRRTVQVVLRGGGRDFDLVPVPGNYEPQYSPGANMPWRVDVNVHVETSGTKPDNSEMLFPPKLGTPWIFNPNLSNEDAQPRIQEVGADSGAETWVREARAVYMAPGGISADDFLILVDPEITGVETYMLDA